MPEWGAASLSGAAKIMRPRLHCGAGGWAATACVALRAFCRVVIFLLSVSRLYTRPGLSVFSFAAVCPPGVLHGRTACAVVSP